MQIKAVKVYSDVDELLPEVVSLKKQGKKIVTTNGCFDLLHTGHVTYLNEAASFGDVLIVGINSDKSVQQIKGPSRPVQKEKDRAFILGSLKMVDYVFIFNEPDPREFLGKIKPDIHVKGGDYSPEKLLEREVVESNGGSVAVVTFVNGYSTTSILQKINDNK